MLLFSTHGVLAEKTPQYTLQLSTRFRFNKNRKEYSKQYSLGDIPEHIAEDFIKQVTDYRVRIDYGGGTYEERLKKALEEGFDRLIYRSRNNPDIYKAVRKLYWYTLRFNKNYFIIDGKKCPFNLHNDKLIMKFLEKEVEIPYKFPFRDRQMMMLAIAEYLGIEIKQHNGRFMCYVQGKKIVSKTNASYQHLGPAIAAGIKHMEKWKNLG